MRVAIIGAGPAGLAAAGAALRSGAEVTVLDEGARSGGQYWRHQPGITDGRLQHGWATFERLLREAEGARTVQRAAVWSIEVDGAGPVRVHAMVGEADGAARRRVTVEADALVVATGAHDRALPLPGWTLPGVTTAGAAQALAKRDGVSVGKRTVVAGAGPFLLPVAASLAAVGTEVVEVLEASRLGTLARGWGRRPWELARSAGKASELLEYAGSLLRGRTPYRVGRGVVRIHGDESAARVVGVVTAALDAQWRPVPGTEREVECDSVALGHGFSPRLEVALAAGCALSADGFVDVDGAQRTSVPTVFAAGEVTGIAGADAALAEGAVAGFSAAGAAPGDRGLARALAARRRAHAFAARLEAAHGIRDGWLAWTTQDTIVCRCESVRRASIEEAAALPPRAMRLATRAGLGACQGRTCGRSVAAIVQAAGGGAVSFDRRPVLAPVRLGELAAEDPPCARRADL